MIKAMEAVPGTDKRKVASRKDWASKMRTEKEKLKVKEEEEEINEEVFSKDTKFSRIMSLHKKFPIQEVTEPDFDENAVILSWYDSDLNLVIDENTFTAASPLHDRGFCYLQGGARATFGFFKGKVCFEVKVLNCCKLLHKEGHLHTHLLRVGWSPRKASLALGSDHKSYGYDSTGRASTIGEIMDYGEKFSTGDVVGAYLDLTDDKVVISFTLNGVDQGVAYEIPQSEIQKEPLFPHVLTKNISYECQFGGVTPWFPLKEGYTFVGDMSADERIAGPKRPKTKMDCEVILMVGLPKSGKTAWVNELREKHPGLYYVIDTATLIDRMEAKDPDRKSILMRKTRVMGKLLAIAMDRRRNYVLDQVNVVRSEQLWKLGLFKNFMRRIVVIVIPDEELQQHIKNSNDRPLGDDSWLLQLKAKFMVPSQNCRHIAEITDKVEFVRLQENEALHLVKAYNHEAWRLGYKPHKNFVIPGYVFKEKQKKVPGSWKERMLGSHKSADLIGSAHWNSSRTNTDGDWQSPSRNRNNEEWQAPEDRPSADWDFPARERMDSDWHSPSRERRNEEWPSSPGHRGGSGARSPFRSKDEDNWQHQTARRSREFESPSRSRNNDRWETEPNQFVSGLQCPPRSRLEDWQSRGVRHFDRRNSPLRRSPDCGERYGGQHSPPRHRIDEGKPPPDANRTDFDFQEDRSGSSRIHDDRFLSSQLHPEDRIGGNWQSRGSRSGNEFLSHRVNTNVVHPHHDDELGSSVHQHENRGGMSGRLPPQEPRMDESFPPHERPMGGGFLLPEGRRGGDFFPGEGRLGGTYVDPSMKMERNLSLREGGMGGDFPPHETRIGTISHSRDGKMSADFAAQNRIGSELPSQDVRGRSDLHLQKDRIGGGFQSIDNRFGTGFSSFGGKMVDRLPPREDRMSNDLPPEGARFGGNFPHRERNTDEMLPRGGRIGGDLPLRGRMSDDFPPQQGNIGGNLPPHGGRMGDIFPQHEGRVGTHMPLHHDRMSDIPPTSGRMVQDVSSHDHRMGGDFPSQEGRSGINLPIRDKRVGGNLPPHLSRMSNTLSIHGRRNDKTVSPLGGRIGSDLPSRGGRIGSDLPPLGGRNGGALPPPGGRIGGTFLPHGGRAHGDLASVGRIEGDLPPHEVRSGGDMQPHDGRSRSGDNWNRLPPNSDCPTNFGPLHKQAWPDEREMEMKTEFFDGARGSGSISDSSTWRKDGRKIQESRWNSAQSDTERHLFKQDLMDSQEQGPCPNFRFREDSTSVNSHSGSIGRMALEVRGKVGWETEVGRPDIGWEAQDVLRSGSSQPERMPPSSNPLDNRVQLFQQQRDDNRKRDSSGTRFHDVRHGSPNPIGRGRWLSPSGRPRHSSRSPVGRSRLDQCSPVRVKQEPRTSDGRLGIRSSPSRHSGHRLSPVGRPRGDQRSPPGRIKEELQSSVGRMTESRHSAVGRSALRGRSPVIGRSASWQIDDRSRSDRQSPERRRPNDRSPGRRDQHSPPRKHPRLEPRKLVGPNVLFPDGEDERNDHQGSGWKSPKRANVGRSLGESNRDRNRGRLPQEMENLNTEIEELAPYEQPFNQAVWDSNEPDAGVFQGHDDRSRRSGMHPMEGRARDSGHANRSETRPPPVNRPRGSVWQRVGGYVDDDDKDHSARDQLEHNQYNTRGPQDDRDNRGHRSIEDLKERERNFEESRNRRGHERSIDKLESVGRKRISPYCGDRGYPKESSRDHWKSPVKKRVGRW